MFATGLVTVLTLFAFAVHGYHPYAEDGGLYMAGIKRVLDPGMYPQRAEFVLEHLRFSAFAPMVAAMVRGSGLSLEVVLLLLQFASFWTTLFAGWMLAARCYPRREIRVGAVALLAVWLTLPIAGTSLMLMDPYVTARSISTPCSLLALVGALAFLLPKESIPGARWRGLALCGVSLTVAALVHPLMAGYALACVLSMGAALPWNRKTRALASIGLCVAGVGTALAIQSMSLPENMAYLSVAMTRRYWFLSEWRWYEWIGVGAPLLILSWVARTRRHEDNDARVVLARMAVVIGGTATVVAMLFARVGLTTHLVARLQPLRVFQLVYVVMILAVGAELAERVLQRRAVRWIAVFGLLGTVMVLAERRTFPASAHVELPTDFRWSAPRNAWVQAFLWIRQNTPKDALLALDADYITRPGEDAQCFRAIAERSALPDYSKDGGEASITPELTHAWVEGQTAQSGLSEATDAHRIAALRPLGVEWVVLERSAATAFVCDYTNEAVKVCRLP
ncbi:MAG TPA: hypothetical protein VIX42_02920 [Edaphobacter sp.]